MQSFWGEGIVNNSHVMGMAQGLAPRDKLATVEGYTRLQRCNLDWAYISQAPIPSCRSKNPASEVLPFGVSYAPIYCVVVSGKLFLRPVKFDHASILNGLNFCFLGHVPFEILVFNMVSSKDGICPSCFIRGGNFLTDEVTTRFSRGAIRGILL